jgi:hypothetical protein
MWNRIQTNVSFLNVIDRKIAELHAHNDSYLPSFADAPRIVVGSDYSGEHAAAKYLGFTFVILPQSSWRAWNVSRLYIRATRNIQERHMAYSSLNDAFRRDALHEFLTALLLQKGMVITIVVNKQLRSIFQSSGQIDAGVWGVEHCGDWRPPEIEKMLRVVHAAAFFIAGVASAGQDVQWITDHDAIAANEARFQDMAAVFKAVLDQYLTVKLGSVRCSTSLESPLEVEDFVAIPDLIGGAMVDLFTAHRRRTDVFSEEMPTPRPEDLSWKTRTIIDWLARRGALRRLIYKFEPGPEAETLEIADMNLAMPLP